MMDDQRDVQIFDETKLLKIQEWDKITSELSSNGLLARALRLSDYEKGYLELLSQLTDVGNVSRHHFQERFFEMKESNSVREHYVIIVIEDLYAGKVVGTSTLFLEMKFIHDCAMRGRLEDVAVLDSYRGRKIGERIVEIIIGLARDVFGCYKLSLDCKDELIRFYEKNKFSPGSNMLCIRF